ncbi:MAG: DUF4442 domain-containing protein [Bdellovibrionota bacterium]
MALLRETFFLRSFGFLKIPLLFYLSPVVEELTAKRCVIRIPLRWRSKNHLGSMYFGALAAGADCAGGFMAMRLIHDEEKKSGKTISLVFKDFKAEFIKRPESDVYFVCDDGQAIRDLVDRTLQSLDRQYLNVHIQASVKDLEQPENLCARFKLGLSLKRK